MDNNNPYQGPASNPQPEVSQGSVIGSARRVSVGHGWHWLRDAWRIVGSNLVLWPLALIVLMLLLFCLALLGMLIPVAGNFLVTIVSPLLVVGLFHIAHRRTLDEEFDFGDVFVGFSRKTKPLLLAGVTQAVLQFAYLLLMVLVFASLFGADIVRYFTMGMAVGASPDPFMMAPGENLLAKGALAGLLVLAAAVPYMAALLFQIPLVYFGDRKPFSALLESFKSTLTNWLSMLWFGVLVMVAGLLLAVAFLVAFTLVGVIFGSGIVGGLLYLVLGLAAVGAGLLYFATCGISVYTAFRDIFSQG